MSLEESNIIYSGQPINLKMLRIPKGAQYKPELYSLTGEKDHKTIFLLADFLIDSGLNEEDYLNILTSGKQEYPLKICMAARLALSKIKIGRVSEKLSREGKTLNLDVVMNLFGEQNRILPHTDEDVSEGMSKHKNGENSIKKKLEEIEWLVGDISNVKVFLNVIDGGDKFGSRDSLNQVINEYGLEPNAYLKVITMDDYESGSEEIHPREGKHGEWQFGARCFLNKVGYPKLAGHSDSQNVEKIIMFNDTDTTFNIAQVGLELATIVLESNDFVYGSRKHKLSILEKENYRHGPGIELYRHIQRVLGRVLFEKYSLADTQAPWKLFKQRAIASIIDDVKEWQHWGGDTAMLLAVIADDDIKMAESFVMAIDSKKESIGINYEGRPAAWRLHVILTGVVEQVQKFLGGSTYSEYDNKLIELFYSRVIEPYEETNEPWKGVQIILEEFNPNDPIWKGKFDKFEDSDWGNSDNITIGELIEIFNRIGLGETEELLII